MPADMEFYCVKFISPKGKIILHKFGYTTEIYSEHRELEASHQVTRDMLLRGVGVDTLIYRNRTEGGRRFVLEIYDLGSHRLQHTLAPQVDSEEWGPMLAVCVLPTNQNVVVLQRNTRTMDIYDYQGKF